MSDFATQSPTVGAIADALAKAQLKIEGAVKDSTNPHYKSQYADLSSVWRACHAPLNENAIAVVQSPVVTENGPMLVTKLLHSSGEWLACQYPLSPVRSDPQGLGSAMTYARRYSLASMCGVAPEDDDGEAASGRGESNKFLGVPQEKPKRATAAPKKEEPKIPDVIEFVPEGLANSIAPLRALGGRPFSSLGLEDLELVLSTCQEFRPRANNEMSRQWLLAIEGAVTDLVRDRQMEEINP